MSLASDISRGLRSLERGLKKPVLTWKGKTYVCIPSTGKESKLLGFGGRSLQDDGTFRIRKVLLPDPGPQVKDLVNFEGRDFRISSIDSPPGNAFLSISVTATAKGI